MTRPFLLATLLICVTFPCAYTQSIDSEEFKAPTEVSRIGTWWHWMDGGLTKEGITKDLEAMKAQGINSATVLNVYRDIGVTEVPKVKFASAEWFDVFSHALKEADRLGMQIGAANCDGWSEAGGPWIKPEQSMKQYTWSKAYLKGDGSQKNIALPKPAGREYFYKDAFVVAYRSAGPNSFVSASPKVTCKGVYPRTTLTKSYSYQDYEVHPDENDEFPGDLLVDGNPLSALTLLAGSQNIDIAFSRPFTSDKLGIYLTKAELSLPMPVRIEVSDDGTSYREVGTVYVTREREMQELEFQRQSARFYRLQIGDDNTASTLGEIELLSGHEKGQFSNSISNFTSKTSFEAAGSDADFYTSDGPSLPIVPNTAEVVDLTAKMSTDGTLHWKAPRGQWTVIRFGFTTTAVDNHPASPEGVGLECDKMDTTALNFHFSQFAQKLIDLAGPLKGKTFTYLLIDSWEARLQNWTDRLPEEFQKRRGYSLVTWIPALCGDMSETSHRTSAFLHDFRKTIGELVEENFFKHFSDLCHRQGMQLYAEGIYGGRTLPPVDALSTYQYCDVPMSEFWTRAGGRDWPYLHTPANYTNHAIPLHASLLYDKPMIGAEAYTGMAFYSESPIDLKLYGDQIQSEGVNQMILHSYVHQPDDRKPGVTLGIYGQPFNRNNSWFPRIGSFFQTLAREQYMLRKGARRADALIYLGDKLPAGESSAEYLTKNLPQNTKFQYINSDVLLHRLSVRDGQILLDGKWPFRFLMLRDTEMNLETARRLEELVALGAVVYGRRPTSTLSLQGLEDNNKELSKIASRVWGEQTSEPAFEHQYGKGRVVWSLRRLHELYKRDVEVKGVGLDDILYLHKTLEDKELYYIVSKNNTSSVSLELGLRSTGAPELWNPQDGTVRRLAIYRESEGYTHIPLTLRPRQSVFIVLDTQTHRADNIEKVISEDGFALFPVESESNLTELPMLYYDEESSTLKAESIAPCSYRLVHRDGSEQRLKLSGAKSLKLDGLRGTMTFEEESQKELGTRPIGGFKRLDMAKEEAVRYYSGEIAYRTNITVPDGYISQGTRVLVSVPEFGSTATFYLSGHQFRTIWDGSDKLDVSGYLKPGDNEIEIHVTNPWRNRLIGDKVRSRGSRDLWTTSPMLQKGNPSYPIITADATLIPSGISAPITFYFLEITNLTK